MVTRVNKSMNDHEKTPVYVLYNNDKYIKQQIQKVFEN